MKAGCRTTSDIVTRGCVNTPVTRRIHNSFADKYDEGEPLVSLTRFQTAEYDGLALAFAIKTSDTPVILRFQKHYFMSSKICNVALLAVVLSLGTLEAAEAQPPVGTRAAGLAGAFVGVADDASAVYWNPAGLATGAIVSAVVMFGGEEAAPDDPQTAAGQRHTARMVALSLPPIGLAYYRLGAYGTAPAQPAGTDAPSREELRRSVQGLTASVVAVSLLQSLTEYVVVGVTPKFVWGSAARGSTGDVLAHDALDTAADLDGVGERAFDVDAGVMVAVQRLRLGLVARNLMTPEFEADAAGGVIEIEREVRVGAGWGSGWPGHTRVAISVDGDLTARHTPTGDRRDLAAGVETWWQDRRLGVRGGVRRSTIGDARGAVAAGVSAGLRPGMLVEAHVVYGHADERGWSVGLRMGF